MAETIIAYGEITILDLLDTATYIYYADNAEGNNPSATSEGKTFIGIYGGPALDSRPSVPDPNWGSDVWSGWQKYVGEDGKNGKDGNGIKSITYYYLTNNSSSKPLDSSITSTAMELPTSTNKFLWQKEVIKYTNGTSQTTVSLLSAYGDKGEDGADGILYNIQTNHEKIYKFYNSDLTGVSYSPGEITFQAFKIENNESSLLNPLSDYNYDITMISNSNNNSFKHIVSFLNNLYVKNSDEDGTLVTLFNKIIDINTNTKSITFKFGSLRNYVLITGDGNTLSNIDSFEELKRLINQENIYFIFKIYRFESGAIEPDNKDLLAVKPIAFEFGTNEEMAKFAVTASSINAAVQNTKLTFDVDGLTIQNGRFEIKNNNGDTLLGYTPPLEGEIGSLEIKGNGEFTGTIHAERGSFTGDVTANTLTANNGNIGGFIITNNGLYSKQGAKPTVNGYDTSGSNIKLLGEGGQIDAEKINLGTGAHINSYIKLTNPNDENDFVTIWNPYASGSENKFIDTKFLKIYADSTMILGAYDENKNFNGLRFDGAQSKISGKSFSITPDLATFNNVNVSGKISTAVFEQNHVQSVGGSMMFKPSYKINSQANNTIVIEKTTEDFLGKVGDYVYLVKQDGTTVGGLIQINNIDGDTITLSEQTPADTLVSLIVLGKEKDLIIGINSNNGPGPSNFLKPRGFTITEFTLAGTTDNKYVDMTQNPKVFLGDLDTSGINFMSDETTLKGFGLYSENVYLTGSLTTQVSTESGPTFAGVNTLNGATATKFTTKIGTISDTSKIVFWAGSASTKNKDIQVSPFQITERGSLYARQGLFEGAIISKSEIKGADIYAARIHGQLDGEANSLTFYDASKGIVFKKGDWDGVGVDNSTEVFSIGEKGLQRGKDNYFIHINEEGRLKFVGDEIQAPEYFTDKTKSHFLHLKDNKIYSSKIQENGQEQFHANITLDSKEISFGLGEDTKELIINSNEIQLNKGTVKMNKTVLFGERLKYEQVDNGYNLYILGDDN